MSPRNAVVVALLTLIAASTASAALSPQYAEWRNGPAQWIMTGAEKSAWKKIASDEDAIRFIDLFWARRDPTAGTPENEARDEHDARVKHADEKFAEPRKRGSLTDRGRVWVVLGTPPSLNEVMGRITNTTDSHVAPAASSGGGRGQSDQTSGRIDPSGGRQMGERDVWVWEHDEASARFGLPRVEVVFVTDPITHRTIRDLFRRDFGAAEAAVLRKQITDDYKELPEWAAFGGLAPKTRVTLPAPSTAPTAAAAPPIQQPRTGSVPSPTVMAPRGATRLTLARNVHQVDAQSNTDPFTKLSASDVFKVSDELGWAAQYCAQTAGEPSVPFLLRITGTSAGKAIDRATPLDEVVPDRIKASPGCYMIRGAIPLDDMTPGSYTLHLTIDDPIVKSDSYDLTHDFTIE